MSAALQTLLSLCFFTGDVPRTKSISSGQMMEPLGSGCLGGSDVEAKSASHLVCVAH